MDGNMGLLAVALMYEHRTRGQSFEDWERDYERMQALADFSGWLRPFRRLYNWMVARRLRRAYGPLHEVTLRSGRALDGEAFPMQVTLHHVTPEDLQAGMAEVEKVRVAPRIKVSRKGRPEAA